MLPSGFVARSGRIIDGEVFDARVEAERIRAEARAEMDRAQGEAERLRAAASAELDRARLTPVGGVPVTAASATAAAAPALGEGHVTEVVGLIIRAEIPGITLGEVVHIERRTAAPLAAEVIGFRGDEAVLLPLGELAQIAPRSRVVRTGAPLSIHCGEALVGRVLDGLGRPTDGGPPLDLALL